MQHAAQLGAVARREDVQDQGRRPVGDWQAVPGIGSDGADPRVGAGGAAQGVPGRVEGQAGAVGQAVLDLVGASDWICHYREGETALPVPRAEVVLSRPADAECPELRVWPTADVLAIFRFYSVEEIDFDVDLRELQGQERLDVFCDFLTVIGRRLGKPVVMYCEGGAPSHPVLGFDVESDQVVLLAKPLVS